MFEKRVIPGKTYCVTAYCPIVVSSVLNNTEVILVDTSEPGQYFFVAPTTTISSSISPNYILEVKGGGAGDSGNSGSGSGSGGGVGISFEKVADFDSLPETGKLGTIYLVPTEDTDNQWTEYVYIDGRYEIIGSKDFTSPDLKNYVKLDADNIFTGNTNTFNGSVNATGLNVANAAISNNLTANSITASSVLATTDATIDGSLIITGELITDGTGKDFQEILDAHIDDNVKHMTTEEHALLLGAAQRDADNTFTASNTFTGTVDMSAAQVTPPAGWNVEGGAELTAEAIEQVIPIHFSSYTAPATSKGAYDIVVGNGASANYQWGGGHQGCIVIGNSAKTDGHSCTVIGHTANAYNFSTVLGYGATAITQNAIAIGYQANASKNHSISIGSTTMQNVNGTWYQPGTLATKLHSIALGSSAFAHGDTAITIGATFVEDIDGVSHIREAKTEGTGSITIGAGAHTLNTKTTVDGVETTVESSNSVTIGCKASNSGVDSVVLGAQAKLNDGAGSVVIGAGASSVGRHVNNVLYPATNSITIGNNATNNSPGAIAIGQNAKSGLDWSIVIGADAKCSHVRGVSIGSNSYSGRECIALGVGTVGEGQFSICGGYQAKTNAYYAVAFGCNAEANGSSSVAIGPKAKAADKGAVVIASLAPDNTKTQLYFSGANTPLANKYFPTAWEQKQDVDEQGNPKVDENGEPVMVDDKDKPIAGEAMMGFVATDKDGNIIARGANMLSALFPYYTGAEDDPFAPTTMSLDGEKPEPVAFHPSDLDLPQEEPTTPEMEEYTPLPVYPIVEPEIEEPIN